MIHHLALAPKDFARAHAFYTEAMGFEVVKVVKRQTPIGGWSKHVFYDTGDDGLFALWELHLDDLPDDAWESAISTGLGLPVWVNHYAFRCPDQAALEAHKQRWLDHGLTVSEVHHEFITRSTPATRKGTWPNGRTRSAPSTRPTGSRPNAVQRLDLAHGYRQELAYLYELNLAGDAQEARAAFLLAEAGGLPARSTKEGDPRR